MKKNLLTGTILGACCIGGAMLSPVMAQDSVELQSVDILAPEVVDSLPPQPTQSTLPEENPLLAPEPSDDVLSSLKPEPAPVTDAANEVVPVERIPHSGQYFDAEAFAPDPALRNSIGPREVDPKYEPGSSFVVVKKAVGANTVQARIIAAQRALSLGRYTSALEIYEKLYTKQPKNERILMGLAVAQQKSGFNESAIATYEELLKVNPKNTDATVNMLGLIRTQYPSVAYRKLKELWEKNSQNPAVAAQLGLMSASTGDIDGAIRYLGVAASIEPRNASHFYNMAVISDQAGAYKDAMELYQKALELDVAYGGGRSIPRDQVYDRLADLRRL